MFVLLFLFIGVFLGAVGLYFIPWDCAGYGFMGSLALGTALVVRMTTGDDSYGINLDGNAAAAVALTGLEGSNMHGVYEMGAAAGDAGDGDCGGGDACWM